LDIDSSALLQDLREGWVLPSDVDKADIVIMLRCPGEIREVTITATGNPLDLTSEPRYMDMRLGPYLDKLRIVYQNIRLPSALSGSQMSFNVPPSMWDTFDERYNPLGTRGHKFVSRFIHLTLRGAGFGAAKPLSIGRLEVYARVAKPIRSPAQARNDLRTREIEEKAKELSTALEKSLRSVIASSTSPALSVTASIQGQFEIDDVSSGDPPENPLVDQVASSTSSTPQMTSSTTDLPATKVSVAADSAALMNYEQAVKNSLTSSATDFTATLELEQLRLTLRMTTAQR
jgi:hypothetical protein